MSKKKLNLEDEFDDHQDHNQLKFNINKQFAQSFENRKKREMMDQAKAKYGDDLEKIVANNLNEESSSSTDEDENGDLINQEISEKFLATLAKIKEKKDEIYDNNKVFFDDNDFQFNNENESLQMKGKKKEKKTYKDIIREEVQKKLENEEQGNNEDESGEDYDDDDSAAIKKIGETPFDEQARIKDEFKKAAQKIESEEADEGDNMFKIKQKTKEQIEEEQNSLQKFIKQNKKKGKNEEADLLKRYWGDESKLDNSDKFLRNYILSKGWIDKDNNNQNLDNAIDQEDENREEEIEQYEQQYNFRFEEPNGAQIIQYKRNIEDSARFKESKRQQQRQAKQEKKKEERNKIEEEIKQLKNIKKSQIAERLQKINKISGSDVNNAKFIDFIEKDYDPKEYDEQMNEKFDDEYYEQSDENEEDIKEYLQTIEQEQIQNDEENSVNKKYNNNDDEDKMSSDKENTLDPKVNIPLGMKKNLNEQDVQAICEENQVNSTQITNLFWYCDSCFKGIKEYEHHYDCQQCPDYTLCKKCFENKMHNNMPDHKLKRLIVPKNCPPPQDSEIKQMLNKFKTCQQCFQKLDEFCNYYSLKSNQDFVFCEECFDGKDNRIEKNKFEFFQQKKIDPELLLEENPLKIKDNVKDEVIQKLIDEYYALDFEDIIAGNIKTRFNYVDVPKESYGLSDENLLFCDPKILNSYISIKNLAPYREDQGKVKSKQIKNKLKLKKIQKSTKLVKYQIRKENNQEQKLVEELNQLKEKKRGQKFKLITKKLDRIKKMKKKMLSVDKFKAKPRMFIEFEDNNKDDLPNIKLKVSNNRLKSYGIQQSEGNNQIIKKASSNFNNN